MFDVFLWSILRKYTSVFLLGFKNTFWISFVSIALALIVGILVGLAKLSRFPLVSRPVSAYVAFIRSTPLLVQIYIIFFGLPHLGITIPTIQAGILALVLNSGAYIAEIVRAGICHPKVKRSCRGHWDDGPADQPFHHPAPGARNVIRPC